ncbi:ArsB/NhaD family transporter [Dactylosporangium siamense]|uniref:Arsenic transporter n=1 Tax=Dactylosporangium siamense TaxID=685454 RepID=A0A919PXA5_9ACTN|nr:arsenic transporter [Dactylosporangium siamense]
MDWVGIGLFVAGGVAVAARLLPVAEAEHTVERIAPLLAFLGAVIVLAELTAQAEVFDVLADRLATLAKGRTVALFGVCVAFAAVTTMILNLDTTAVLLTPVMLALARRLGLPPLPLAVTTVWLANTASLLLPVSNLTNLLAAGHVGLGPVAFAGRMWLPQLAAISVTAVALWVAYWRRTARGFTPPPPHRPADPVLFRVALAACLVFVAGVLLEVPLWMASGVAAAALVVAFAVRARGALRPALLPWRLLVFVTGMFLVVETLGAHGLDRFAGTLIGTDGGPVGAFRAAATGMGLANLVNNLPAYIAGEGGIGAGHRTQLLALLVGVNVGPLAAPWASLATLLWWERCRAGGVQVPAARFLLWGTGVAVAGTALATAALLV